MNKFNFLSLMLVLGLSISACKKNEDAATDSDEAASNISESAMSEAAQNSTATEGSGSVSFLNENFEGSTAFVDFIDPQDEVRPFAACTLASARSTCSSNVSTVAWAGCTVGTATLSGGWTETWSGGFCADSAQAGVLTNGNSVTRTSTGQTITFASGASLSTSTLAHTTYDSTSIPATGITVTMAGGTRTVVINGIRRILTGPLGRTWFNHSITSSGVSITGTRAGGNRVVTGTSTVFHNIASYKAVHTYNSVTWGSSSCCYPTSGNISSVLTGTRSGNVSLAFSATCGSATFTDTTGTASTITLSQCN